MNTITNGVGFNPCFNGYSILMNKGLDRSRYKGQVSILVLMDTLF